MTHGRGVRREVVEGKRYRSLLRAAFTAFLPACTLPVPALTPLSAQQVLFRTEDASLPGRGVVRFEVAPVFLDWYERFDEGGDRRSLAEDFDGPLLERVFPDAGAALAGLNADAAALGFEPLDPAEVSTGALEVRELSRFTRTVPFYLEIGILDRISLDLAVPLVRTESEPFLDFDPTGATLAAGATALPAPDDFLEGVDASLDALASRIESGGLTAAEETRAMELLQSTDLFAATLRRRIEANAPLPLAPSTAGQQMLAHFAALAADFQSFGLGLPGLVLPDSAGAGLLASFFLGALDAPPPVSVERGWNVGEVEAGLRFAVLDGYRAEPGGLQHRTTAGVRARVPSESINSPQFVVPSDFIGVPLGDGQDDVEFSLYQDLRAGPRFEVNAVARFGIQLSETLTTRVTSRERPFAPASQTLEVERDPGDYVRLRLAPRFTLQRFLSLGLEYRLWHRAEDEFRALDGSGEIVALSRFSEQTLHRFGVGAFFRPPSAGEEGEALPPLPTMGFVYQAAVAGSGGATPASGLVTFQVRMPASVF